MKIASQKTSTRRNWRYWRNLLVFSLLASTMGCLFIQFIAYPVFLAYGYSHPKPLAVCCYTPADLELAYEDVSLTTSDGLTLKGWYIPSENQAAVMVFHPLAANRLGTMDGATMLARHGYGVLMLDLRMHGESEGEVYPYGGPEIEDVRAAVTYLQTRSDVDPERIGVLGWSLGAQVGILGAAAIPDIKAVVADGPGATAFEDWPPPQTFNETLAVPLDFVFYTVMPFYTDVDDPISIKESIGRISPRPILLISADFESEKRRTAYFLDAAQEPKSLWLIPGVSHIEGITKRPEAYEEKVITFFNEALLKELP